MLVTNKRPMLGSVKDNGTCQVLIVERINERFQAQTRTKQVTGLTNCIDHIVRGVNGVKSIQVQNLGQMVEIISRYSPKKVIFEALVVSKQVIEQIRGAFPNIQIFVHVHSHLPFLTEEGNGVMKINEYISMGVGVIYNCYEAWSCLKYLGVKNSYLLENIYLFEQFTQLKEEDEFLDVACFGSLRSMKNQPMQAMAAIMAAESMNKKLRFHMNLGRNEGGNAVRSTLTSIFDAFQQHELVRVDWMEQKEIIQYCRKMDLGMQLSMTESFNLVAADYTSAGIPMVVSNEIRWAFGEFSSCTFPHDIMARIGMAIKNKTQIVSMNSQNLKDHNEKAIKQWSDFLET